MRAWSRPAVSSSRRDSIRTPSSTSSSRATSLPRIGLRGVGSVIALDDGARLDEYGLPGSIVYTTGHSAGDISLLLDDGTAFVGDAVQGRRIPGVTPPELPNMALDVDEVLASWESLLDAGATTIYPAHGSVISADELRPVLDRKIARREARFGAEQQQRVARVPPAAPFAHAPRLSRMSYSPRGEVAR